MRSGLVRWSGGQVVSGPGGTQCRPECCRLSWLWHLAGPFPHVQPPLLAQACWEGQGAGPGPPLLLAPQTACSPHRSQWEAPSQLPRCAVRHQAAIHSSAAGFTVLMSKSPPSAVLSVLSCTLGTAVRPTARAGVGCSGDDGAGSASASVTNVRLEKGHMSEDDFGCLSRIWPHPSS